MIERKGDLSSTQRMSRYRYLYVCVCGDVFCLCAAGGRGGGCASMCAILPGRNERRVGTAAHVAHTVKSLGKGQSYSWRGFGEASKQASTLLASPFRENKCDSSVAHEPLHAPLWPTSLGGLYVYEADYDKIFLVSSFHSTCRKSIEHVGYKFNMNIHFSKFIISYSLIAIFPTNILPIYEFL